MGSISPVTFPVTVVRKIRVELARIMNENQVLSAIFDYLVFRRFLVIRINSGAIKAEYKGKDRYFQVVRWQTRGGRKESKGVSDILALSPRGTLLAIECKSPGKIGETSEYQGKFLEAIEKRGGIAIIADDVDEFKRVVDQIG